MPADGPRAPEHIIWKKKAPKPKAQATPPSRFARLYRVLAAAGFCAVLFLAWIASPRRTSPAVVSAKGVRPLALPEGSVATGLAAGKDGLWVALSKPAGFLLVSYTAPHALLARVDLEDGSRPLGSAVAADGSLWATLDVTHRLAKLEAAWPYALTVFGPQDTQSRPARIAAASDGALWFTDRGAGRLGRIEGVRPHSMTATVLPSPGRRLKTEGSTFGVASAPDGLLWFTRDLKGELCSFRPGALTEIRCRPLDLPKGTQPRETVVSPDGRIFFTLSTPDLGIWEPATGLRILPLATGTGGGRGIAASASGFVYVTGAREIFQIESRTSGNVRTFTLPAPFFAPSAVAVAPDGSVYFVDGSAKTLGRFEPEGKKPPG